MLQVFLSLKLTSQVWFLFSFCIGLGLSVCNVYWLISHLSCAHLTRELPNTFTYFITFHMEFWHHCGQNSVIWPFNKILYLDDVCFFSFEKLTLFSCYVREKLLTLSQINAFNASFLKTTFWWIKVIVFFNLNFFQGYLHSY